MGREAPSMSHLLFADDLILFAMATLREATKFDECFEKYTAWPDQKLNRENLRCILVKIFEDQRYFLFWISFN